MAFSGRKMQMDIPVEMVAAVDAMLEAAGCYERESGEQDMGGGSGSGQPSLHGPQPPDHSPPRQHGVRGRDGQHALPAGSRSPRRGRAAGRGSGPAIWSSNDWICRSCGYSTFGRNNVCRQ